MQQLSEGNIELRPAIKHRRKKRNQKSENTKIPYKIKQTTLNEYKKEQQRTLFDYT